MRWGAERLLDAHPSFLSPIPDIPHHHPTFEGDTV